MQGNMKMCQHRLKDGTKQAVKFLKDLLDAEKQKHFFLKEKIGLMSEMKIKFDSELLLKAAAHAESRGMTLEEYIQEFVTMLKEEKWKDESSISRN